MNYVFHMIAFSVHVLDIDTYYWEWCLSAMAAIPLFPFSLPWHWPFEAVLNEQLLSHSRFVFLFNVLSPVQSLELWHKLLLMHELLRKREGELELYSSFASSAETARCRVWTRISRYFFKERFKLAACTAGKYSSSKKKDQFRVRGKPQLASAEYHRPVALGASVSL